MGGGRFCKGYGVSPPEKMILYTQNPMQSSALWSEKRFTVPSIMRSLKKTLTMETAFSRAPARNDPAPGSLNFWVITLRGEHDKSRVALLRPYRHHMINHNAKNTHISSYSKGKRGGTPLLSPQKVPRSVPGPHTVEYSGERFLERSGTPFVSPHRCWPVVPTPQSPIPGSQPPRLMSCVGQLI